MKRLHQFVCSCQLHCLIRQTYNLVEESCLSNFNEFHWAPLSSIKWIISMHVGRGSSNELQFVSCISSKFQLSFISDIFFQTRPVISVRIRRDFSKILVKILLGFLFQPVWIYNIVSHSTAYKIAGWTILKLRISTSKSQWSVSGCGENDSQL